jgi:hypothetical protein
MISPFVSPSHNFVRNKFNSANSYSSARTHKINLYPIDDEKGAFDYLKVRKADA